MIRFYSIFTPKTFLNFLLLTSFLFLFTNHPVFSESQQPLEVKDLRRAVPVPSVLPLPPKIIRKNLPASNSNPLSKASVPSPAKPKLFISLATNAAGEKGIQVRIDFPAAGNFFLESSGDGGKTWYKDEGYEITSATSKLYFERIVPQQPANFFRVIEATDKDYTGLLYEGTHQAPSSPRFAFDLPKFGPLPDNLSILVVKDLLTNQFYDVASIKRSSGYFPWGMDISPDGKTVVYYLIPFDSKGGEGAVVVASIGNPAQQVVIPGDINLGQIGFKGTASAPNYNPAYANLGLVNFQGNTVYVETVRTVGQEKVAMRTMIDLESLMVVSQEKIVNITGESGAWDMEHHLVVTVTYGFGTDFDITAMDVSKGIDQPSLIYSAQLVRQKMPTERWEFKSEINKLVTIKQIGNLRILSLTTDKPQTILINIDTKKQLVLSQETTAIRYEGSTGIYTVRKTDGGLQDLYVDLSTLEITRKRDVTPTILPNNPVVAFFSSGGRDPLGKGSIDYVSASRFRLNWDITNRDSYAGASIQFRNQPLDMTKLVDINNPALEESMIVFKIRTNVDCKTCVLFEVKSAGTTRYTSSTDSDPSGPSRHLYKRRRQRLEHGSHARGND